MGTEPAFHFEAHAILAKPWSDVSLCPEWKALDLLIGDFYVVLL